MSDTAQRGLGAAVVPGNEHRPPVRRHDPRIDTPTKKDRRRILWWFALLALSPVCLGVVAWAALGLNGNYPTVSPPVPAGWKSVPGIYASISVPRGWALRAFLSDDSGDVYYSGRGGGVGLSVVEADHLPSATKFPKVVSTFVGGSFRVSAMARVKLANATDAWHYTLALPGGARGSAILAWAHETDSEVWLVATTVTPTTSRVLGTLTLWRPQPAASKAPRRGPH